MYKERLKIITVDPNALELEIGKEIIIKEWQASYNFQTARCLFTKNFSMGVFEYSNHKLVPYIRGDDCSQEAG